ncbi:MAG: hypothetical protein QM711_04445 [Micropruina sp.]|uniref:hypothetical protein n=1 Tax=Micropruina sp. TaxID=2737536 RepID=UPI0039E57413
MDLSSFYSLMAVTCFTLVGLWWTVVERHPEWKVDRTRRRLAGGVYLSFLLPGLMSMFAQVDTGNPLIWRTSFTAAALIGIVNTVQLLGVDDAAQRGPFRRFRGLVALIYAVIAVIGLFPAVSSVADWTPLQAAALALILLVVLAHGLAWEFMMEHDEPSNAASD